MASRAESSKKGEKDSSDSDVPPIETDTEDNPQVDDEHRSAKKRAVATRRTGNAPASHGPKINKRSRVGKLARLNSIPTDVFLEIATHLQPLDILHMARTTKAWRATLMSKSSKAIWRAARSSISELPDCPEDLSEAQYARLMFGNDCYVCGTKNVPWTSPELRVRVCRACAKFSVIPQWQAVAMCTLYSAGGFVKIAEVLPHCLGGPHTRQHYEHFYKPDVVKVIEILKSKATDNDRLKWAVARRPLVVQILESALVLRLFHGRWCVSLKHQYDEGLVRKVEKRRNREIEIERRFMLLGYDKADIRFTHENRTSHVAVARALTDKAWAKVRPILEAEVIKNRDLRLAEERYERGLRCQIELKQLYNKLPRGILCAYSVSSPGTVKLSMSDFYNLPSIRPLWQDHYALVTDKDWPDSKVLHDEILSFWRTLQTTLQAILVADLAEPLGGPVEEANIAAFIAEIKDEPTCARIFCYAQDEFPHTESAVRSGWKPHAELCRHPRAEDRSAEPPSLDDPAAVFACSRCHQPLHWPTLVNHTSCCRDEDGYLSPWNAGLVYTSPLLRAVQAQMATAADISPGAGLHCLRYECRSCDQLKMFGSKMSWESFITHVVDSYYLEHAAVELEAMKGASNYTEYPYHMRRVWDEIIKSHPPRTHAVEAGGLLISVKRVQAST